jgi:Iap family predicted aminopeptidase
MIPDEVIDHLLAECLGRPNAYEALVQLCDRVGGRTSGLLSGRQAEEWAFVLFARYGLTNPRYEDVPVTAWERGTLEVAALDPASWRLTALAHGNAPSQAEVAAPVVDVGHGEREQFEEKKEQVVGSIALCDEGATEGRRVLHRSEKLRLAIAYRAAGLMIQSSAPGGLPRTGVGHYGGEAPIPSVGIALEDGLRLKRLIAQGANPHVRIQMRNRFAEMFARNVIAEIPGEAEPETVVLAGAHLDSWDVAQGATDNGLGCAIVLEMARALASLPRRPRCTLRFALWAAEEVGLLGSREYARRHAAALPNHRAVMNFDMTGDPYGFVCPQPRSADPPRLVKDLAARLAGLGMREEFSSKATLHSDHQPFLLAGVPVVMLLANRAGDGAHYYHSVGDTIEKVSLPAMARAAAVGACTLWCLSEHADLVGAFSPMEVRTILEESDLMEALNAEGYDGPPMHVPYTKVQG